MAGSATVGSAVIKLSFDGKNVKAELDGVSKQVESTGTKSGKLFGDAWTVAAGNLIAKGIAKITSNITASFDTAIARVDTLNNSQKVFKAMGYSAEATSESMNALTEYLDGLPTSMTTAVSAVQSLSASFGGIERGTEIFIDINNAGLAFGATTAQIENAIMQLGQTSLDGPLDAATWNSLRNSGFSPVFAAMAKEAGITVGELKEQFGAKGDKTVNDFLQQLHKLGTEGGADMDSLAELAKQNTSGIGTAIENLRNRIGKAIAKIIDHIGSEKIAGAINAISSSFSSMADGIIAAIDFVVEHWDVIGPIVASLAAISGAIIAINLALKAYHKIQTAVNAVQKIFSKGLGAISSGYQKVTGAFKKSPIGGEAAKVGNIFKSLAETIKSALKNIGEILTNLVQAITEPLKAALKGIGEALAGFFQSLASPAVLMGAVSFAAVAASIAAAIWLIGSAVGAVMPVLTDLLNNIIMPIAQFVADTLMTLIQNLTDAVILLTQNALIPLGEFLTNAFVQILTTVSDVITGLTQNALVPLINTLSGAFTNVISAVANLITGVLNAALSGIANIVRAVGEGFVMMGQAIKLALEGVQGVLQAFAALITAIAAAAVAIVALVTGHSINYGDNYAHLFSEGGKVEGPGTATSDSIPAMLSNGEYVINARSAQLIGYDNLDALNEGNYYSFAGLTSDFASDYGRTSITGDGVTVYMTNQINNEMDAQDIGRVMMQSIRRAT